MPVSLFAKNAPLLTPLQVSTKINNGTVLESMASGIKKQPWCKQVKKSKS